MKRLLIVALAVLAALSGPVKAEGPDDKYIEIYRAIQEGDQLATIGQSDAARHKYADAQAELKKLQASYPNWNQKLIEFRLRTLDAKLAGSPKPPTAPGPATGAGKAPATSAAPEVQAPAAPAPAPRAEVDDRDNQIKALRDQVGRLENDRNVLQAKLKEAISAQPAAVDPQELARAEEKIRTLEKEKEILKVSVQVAETKAAQRPDPGVTELKSALAESKQKLAEQNDAIMALRQEKTVLQQHLQESKPAENDTVKTLQAENESLKKQLTEKSAAPSGNAAPRSESELTSTKAALQSSRDTVASLQSRLRTLQEERDRLDKTRKELETKLASAPAPAARASETAQLKDLQKERDDLRKKLNDATRQMADHKSKGKVSAAGGQPVLDDVSGLRARLEVFEARKVPYTPEELALFKKPQEPAALTAAPAAATTASQELPASAAPLLAEAQRAFNARRFDDAEKKYLEVLRLDEKNVATLQRLASSQLEQNRAADAEATLKRALDQNPREARTLLLMGIAKFEQNKFDEAFDVLSRSAVVDPQNAETQNYLGITLSQKGQRAAAETALRKSIQLSPSYASAHYNLAVVYATQQPPFTELARWHYQKALAFGHPQNAEVEKMLERRQAATQK